MPEKLIVVDAFAHIYQFFYAIRGLTGPDGEPVNAVYGFARMLENLRTKYAPDYLVVAFDSKGPLNRSEVYPDYKANRDPMPEALQRQIPLILELLQAQSVPCISVEGYEADDVLGAVAGQATRRGLETIVVTTDKDAEQLIDEHTSVLHVHKNREELLDAAALMELKGIEPRQVLEVMSLCGDSTDNIPGVPGIGPKTAVKLIAQFSTVEALYRNLDQVPSEKMRRKLLDHKQDVELTRRLVRLYCDIPVELDLEAARVGQHDPAALDAFYRALGFQSLRDDAAAKDQPGEEQGQTSLFGDEGTEPESTASLATVQKEYATIADPEGVAALAEKLRQQEIISVDLETTSLHVREATLVGLAFSWRPDQGVYVATAGPEGSRFCPPEDAVRLLKPVLEAKHPGKIGQNLKYDMAVLKNYGVEVNGLRCDSMVASYLLHPSRRGHGLDALALHHLDYRTVKISELIGKGSHAISMDQVPIDEVAPYACEDADVALQLCNLLSRQLRNEDLWDLFERLELPLVPVLAAMEWTGVRVDTELLSSLSARFAGELAELEKLIHSEAGHEFNVNSPKQLSQVLYEEMGLPTPRGGKRTTGYSTASSALEALKGDHAIVDHVLRYRELSKLKSTYADALVGMVCPETGRVHASFNQTITATGRLSSSDPNLQNIPVRTPLGRGIRRAFIAGSDDMSLLSADYSQVELRLLAHCCGDPNLCRAFDEDRDIHRFVAAQVHGVTEEDVTAEMRQQAKGVNFGIIYGQGPYGLSRAIGISVPEAEQFIAGYFHRYPRVKEFIGEIIEQARRDGHVKTLAGRKRTVEGIDGTGAARAAAERIAVNTVIQGSAADLIKLAMIEIHNGLASVSERARMLLQIHDELVFEAPDEELDGVKAFVRSRMSGALDLKVNLKVDIAVAKNWADAK